MTEKQMESIGSCGGHHGNKAIYFCNVPTCRFNLLQPYYCEDCMSEEKHNHLPTRIHNLIQKILEHWHVTNKAISEKVEAAKGAYRTL